MSFQWNKPITCQGSLLSGYLQACLPSNAGLFELTIQADAGGEASR